MWATGTNVALTLAVKASHLFIYALTSNMAKLTTLSTPKWCRNISRSTTTTTSTTRLRHAVSWLKTPISWLKSSIGKLESTDPVPLKMVAILPKRGKIRLSTVVSHKLPFFPMTDIGIPIEYGLFSVILIKDPTHVDQLCKVVDVVVVHHHLHFLSGASDKLHPFTPLPSFPLKMRKIPYYVLKPSCIHCHRHAPLF